MSLPPGCNNIDLEGTGADEGPDLRCEAGVSGLEQPRGCLHATSRASAEIGPELEVDPGEIDPDRDPEQLDRAA